MRQNGRGKRKNGRRMMVQTRRMDHLQLLEGPVMLLWAHRQAVTVLRIRNLTNNHQ